ncbi:hypothetical protein T492DRAFT_113133 [Pavlovales sp. CCMP2436]|nr:hypothetical protein T492DRAFT_113133 [Pavlovales sp. CCMP2436]
MARLPRAREGAGRHKRTPQQQACYMSVSDESSLKTCQSRSSVADPQACRAGAQVDHRDEDGLLPATVDERQVNLDDDGKQGPVVEARDIYGLPLLVASSARDVLADTSALHRCWPRLRNIARAARGVTGGGDALAGVGRSPLRRHPANVARSTFFDQI